MAILSVDLAFRSWSELGVVILRRATREESTSNAAAQVECEIVPMSAPGLDPAIDRGPHGQLLGREMANARPGKKRADRMAKKQNADGNLLASKPQNSSASEPRPLPATEEQGPIDAEILAGRLNHLCAIRNIHILMLDGPQAWKSGSSRQEYARDCELQLNTTAKTGLPGLVQPPPYRSFAEFCMDVYDALGRRGWHRFETSHAPLDGEAKERMLVESNPQAAWEALGLQPLPAKHEARISDLAQAYAALQSVAPFTCNRPPNHGQLQAIVAGLPGLALETHDTASVRIVGKPPCREEGHWREGFIVLPLPPARHSSLRWLN